MRNIVYRSTEQHGILPMVSLPGGTQYQVARMLSALAMHDGVARSIKYYDLQFRKEWAFNLSFLELSRSGQLVSQVRIRCFIVRRWHHQRSMYTAFVLPYTLLMHCN